MNKLQDSVHDQGTAGRLRAGEECFHAFADCLPDAYFLYDADGIILDANRQACEAHGFTREELVGMKPGILDARDIPRQDTGSWFASGEKMCIEARCRRKDGSVFQAEISIFPFHDGGSLFNVVRVNDLGERQHTDSLLHRLNRQLSTFSKCAQVMMRASNEQALLEEFCQIICNEGGYRMAWVGGYADLDEAKTVRAIAQYGFDEGHLNAAAISWAEAPQGPTAAAIRTGVTQINQDFLINPRTLPWLEEAGRRGYRASIALPLEIGDGTHACLTIYAGEPDAFAADEVSLLEKLADNLAFGIDVLRMRDERKKAEQALRKSEERYRTIFLNSPLGIFRSTVDGRFLEANPALAKMLGYGSPEELINEIVDIGEQIYAQAENRKKIVARQLGAAGDVMQHNNHYKRRDGSKFIANLYLKTVRDDEGMPIFFDGIIEDITERKRFEDELRDSETRFRIFADHSLDALFLHGEKGVVLDVNHQACLNLGYSREELIGMNPGQFDADLSQEYRDSLRERVHRGEIVAFESHHRRKDGSVFPVEMHLRPFLGGDGSLMISLARDISERVKVEDEREKLQAQLSQAQKMESVGRLAGGIAHDFNNILSAIIGYTELALQDLHPDDRIFSHLKEVRNAANRSGDLIRQLLAFARKQTVLPKVIDLNETVTGMIGLLRGMISEEIHLAWVPGDAIWPVKVDPVQIDQVLTNLCVNARDAISGQGEIIVDTCNAILDRAYAADHPGAVPGNYVLLRVRDNGHGMVKETLDHVFEPFFTTKDIGQGTGLGLATVYGIVKQNKGFIDISSKPGYGTTASIYLPSHAGESGQAGEKGATAEGIEQGHETVLIVEDEPLILDIAKLILEQCGYRVLTAPLPDQALRLAEEHAGAIDLLVTDVTMPGMNGRQLADRLLSLYPEMHCLFMSGYSGDAIAHHGVLDEDVHFIQKPFSMSDLAATVRKVLDEG